LVAIAISTLPQPRPRRAELTGTGPGQAIGIADERDGRGDGQRRCRGGHVEWGRIDVLVSNAGIQIVAQAGGFPFADLEKSFWRFISMVPS